jgi:hypothetical protein
MVDSIQEFNLKPKSDARPALRPYNFAYDVYSITYHILEFVFELNSWNIQTYFISKAVQYRELLLQISRDNS